MIITMNKKSSLFTSIILQLLAMALIPLVVLGIVCIVTAGSSLRDGLQEEALAQMKATCVAAKAAYDNINDGDYVLNENQELMKGDYNITQNERGIDAFTEGLNSDITLFYGDVKASDILKGHPDRQQNCRDTGVGGSDGNGVKGTGIFCDRPCGQQTELLCILYSVKKS